MIPVAPLLPDEHLTRDDVIERLCSLASRVMRERFNCTSAADCFCGAKSDAEIELSGGYRFSERIMRFIEEAVDVKLYDEGITYERADADVSDDAT